MRMSHLHPALLPLLRARAVRTLPDSIRSSDRLTVAESKIEELEYRLQQERIARLKSENELETLKRAELEKAIADAKLVAGR